MEILPFIDRLVSAPIKPINLRVGRLSPQAKATRQRLLDPTNPFAPIAHFRSLHHLLTPAEEHRYLESFASAADRERRLYAEYQTKIKPSGWQTTDPLHHDPDNFRYIVHTTTKEGINYTIWWRTAKRGEPKKQYLDRGWQETLTDFLFQTDICCTLVDEMHRGTYAQSTVSHGLILEVPEENILAVDPFDRGTQTQNQDRQKREEFYRTRESTENQVVGRDKLVVRSAQEFFNNGTSDAYNEVVVDGIGSNGRQIRISGIFLIVDPVLGIPKYEIAARLSWSLKETYYRLLVPNSCDMERQHISQATKLYQEAKELAQFLHIPIIHIPAFI